MLVDSGGLVARLRSLRSDLVELTGEACPRRVTLRRLLDSPSETDRECGALAQILAETAQRLEPMLARAVKRGGE